MSGSCRFRATSWPKSRTLSSMAKSMSGGVTDVELRALDAVAFRVELDQARVDLLERRPGRCADVRAPELGFRDAELLDRVVGFTSRGCDRYRPVVVRAHVPLVHDGFALERAAHIVESRQRLLEPAVLLLRAQRFEPVAQSGSRDHDEREEWHEENEQELRPEAQPRKHPQVSASPASRLNQRAAGCGGKASAPSQRGPPHAAARRAHRVSGSGARGGEASAASRAARQERRKRIGASPIRLSDP